jgi:16S rRNA (guanine527-N7)-methyltransferase
VKHPFDLEMLFSFLRSQSIDLSGHQKDQFKNYQKLIKMWSEKQNLISKNDISHLVERHFLPSAFFSRCLPNILKGKIIDVGTGAGFPGVIMKIIQPEISLTLLDSSRKKVLFLEEVCDQLNLDCPVVNLRCEEFRPPLSDCYHNIISRAVARLKLLWEWSGHLIVPGGHLYTFKGGDYQEEIEELVDDDLNHEVIVPDKDWLEASGYLNQKCIVKLEK